MSWALVFSGQGLQHRDMLPWLAHDDVMQRVVDTLGADWRTQLDLPDLAADNHRTQWLLTGTGCAAWMQLQPLLDPPAIIAGYSVGEMAACAAAGVLDPATAFDLAGERARCMDAAGSGVHTGLLAISGAAEGGIDALCVRHGLDCAIRIDPGSAVLGGLHAALQAAALEADAHGWRTTRLNVALASHTRWMASASRAFAHRLESVEMRPPTHPLLTHACGRVRDAATVRTALSRQLAQCVRWDDCMDAIAAQGVRAVLEIGPGQALARMWNERFEGRPARSADEFRSALAIARWLHRCCD